MLSIDEIKQLIELIDESTLDEFELETKDSKILLKKHKTVVATAVQEAPIAVAPAQTAPVTPATAHQVEASTAEDVNLEVITSPMVGTFYASASPEDANFVSVGSKVSAQSVVCIVEAMKLFNEITADIDGEIAEILVSSGELVEFGQPLFKVRKNKGSKNMIKKVLVANRGEIAVRIIRGRKRTWSGDSGDLFGSR